MLTARVRRGGLFVEVGLAVAPSGGTARHGEGGSAGHNSHLASEAGCQCRLGEARSFHTGPEGIRGRGLSRRTG